MHYRPAQPTFVIVGGPAGTGKSTIGLKLAETFDAPYIEGDDLHPKANVEKMAKGIPLQDEDRWGWLETIASVGSEKALESKSHISVGSCSALTIRYRDYLAQKIHKNIKLIIVFFHTSQEELTKRVLARKNHYMGANMVQSQYSLMEIPQTKEKLSQGGSCINVEATQSVEEIYEFTLLHLQEHGVIKSE